ncbi:MAG: hypothetical protein J6P57_08840 [Lachnospiraceae bacterium]|nr:hypothetical protein [Lachnospiraceae bacterium]
MKNGWKKLWIISLVIILIEIVGAVVVMLPFYTRNMVFVNIDKGDAAKTDGYFNMLNESGQEKVNSYLDDFAATICQRYIDEKNTYEETMASLDAIKEVEKDNNVSERYIKDVASNEFVKVLNEIYDADLSRDTNKSYNLQPKLELVKQRLDNDTREKLMITFLNKKYMDFLNGAVTGEGINEACTLVMDNAYYDAYDYAKVIASNAGCVVMYRSMYTKLQEDMTAGNYFEVLDISSNITVDKWDNVYRQMFDDIYTQAYDEGLEYYKNELDKLVASNDKKAVVELVDKIEIYYGDAIDTSSVGNKLFEQWQQAYIDYMETFDPQTLSHTVNTVLLYDINDDDVPEMFLFDIADIDKQYIGCEVYNVSGSKCKDLGYYNVINICDDGYLITLPSSGGGDEAYALTSYDGSKLTEGDNCKKVGENYYINGTEVGEPDFLSVRTGILGHASAYTISNSKNASLEEAVDYIMLFENK